MLILLYGLGKSTGFPISPAFAVPSGDYLQAICDDFTIFSSPCSFVLSVLVIGDGVFINDIFSKIRQVYIC